ncbi:MAG: response regulator [Planctomycetes bacterium]|nr:response regulator [Planctomycetota bacterium]
MNVLVADADEESRLELSSLIKEFFSEKGEPVTIFEVGTGSQAQMTISLNDVDMIFIDVRLPHKDGLSILRDLRADDIDTTVVFVSSMSVQSIIERAKELDIDDYICKPFSDVTIKEKLAKLSAQTG